MLVIVGSGLAGYTLLRELRKRDATRPVTLVTADDGRFYSKPLLSTGFARGKQAGELPTADAGQMAEQTNAEIRIHSRVSEIDPDGRRIRVEGAWLAYEQLVLAVGARARKLGVEGDGAADILSINDLADYSRFRNAMPAGGEVVILGGGLIGCEFADDLRAGGHRVSVVTPTTSLLPGLVPEAIGNALASALRASGVRIQVQDSARGVHRNAEKAAHPLRVDLAGGTTLQADVVLSAIGLDPDLQLAREAGLETGRGIKVDVFCRTSNPAIYALGDCAELDGRNLLYVQPLMVCARALAQTLTGAQSTVEYPHMPVVVKTPSCPVVVLPPAGPADWAIETGPSELDVRALCRNPEGGLAGFALSGICAAERQKWLKELA